ncbi:YMGG-like glycine zipper-containing protein [Parvularcula maris]|uniref:YMGG-like glycine zipper-containing protein n=1 Tax=Parvularcula maris TaxID=2965077 RepID=A0A9X2L6Y7_9PROT|nr:YMGG-like glycine zipper-containing protein [Parvularcula maris]MCQ8184294.1 YMGG-like glycine zipper-containing protein [Parvularcula maris]
MRILLGLAGLSALALGACTTTGNVERNAVGGAALGAAAGAVIGNNVGDGDADRGAAIGAAVGGTAGAIRGRQQDVQSGEGTRLKTGPDGRQLYFDERAQRYYYYDETRDRTYWQNGAVRG